MAYRAGPDSRFLDVQKLKDAIAALNDRSDSVKTHCAFCGIDTEVQIYGTPDPEIAHQHIFAFHARCHGVSETHTEAVSDYASGPGEIRTFRDACPKVAFEGLQVWAENAPSAVLQISRRTPRPTHVRTELELWPDAFQVLFDVYMQAKIDEKHAVRAIRWCVDRVSLPMNHYDQGKVEEMIEGRVSEWRLHPQTSCSRLILQEILQDRLRAKADPPRLHRLLGQNAAHLGLYA